MLRQLTKKQRTKDAYLRRTYSITLEEYNAILKMQGGCCAICHKPATHFKKALAVDHCHKTGLVRGLLCWPCNGALQRFRDDIEKLRSAVVYLHLPPAVVALDAPRYTAPGEVGTKKRAKLLKILERNGF